MGDFPFVLELLTDKRRWYMFFILFIHFLFERISVKCAVLHQTSSYFGRICPLVTHVYFLVLSPTYWNYRTYRYVLLLKYFYFWIRLYRWVDIKVDKKGESLWTKVIELFCFRSKSTKMWELKNRLGKWSFQFKTFST